MEPHAWNGRLGAVCRGRGGITERREVFFADGEYDGRLARVRARMAAEGYDLLVTTVPGNV